MSSLTIRIPESKYNRLRSLAKARGMSVDRLMDELATSALTQYDTETRFEALAQRGSRKRGFALLDKLGRPSRRAVRQGGRDPVPGRRAGCRALMRTCNTGLSA